MEVSEFVRRRAEGLGAEGERWLSALPATLAALERHWGIAVEQAVPGSSTGLVLRVRTSDGAAAVLKLELPDPRLADDQARTLAAAGGDGYVLLLAQDTQRRAMLMEALGPSLADAGYGAEDVIAILAGLLLRCWRVPRPPDVTMEQATSKAVSLAALVDGLWPALGTPCSERVAAQALEFAERRRRAGHPDRVVVVHGDPHPGNALELLSARPGGVRSYVFVDPDGFVADPAYDAGVVLRDWCTEILAGGAAEAAGRARRYARLVADRCGLDPQAVWEWGFLERVTTGLYLLDLGAPDLAAPFLESAELLVGDT